LTCGNKPHVKAVGDTSQLVYCIGKRCQYVAGNELNSRGESNHGRM